MGDTLGVSLDCRWLVSTRCQHKLLGCWSALVAVLCAWLVACVDSLAASVSITLSCCCVRVSLAVRACMQADFRKAKEKVLYKKKEGVPEGLYM